MRSHLGYLLSQIQFEAQRALSIPGTREEENTWPTCHRRAISWGDRAKEIITMKLKCCDRGTIPSVPLDSKLV